MASRPAKKLVELDRNFRVQTTKATLRWHDAFDRRLALRGLAWPTENRRKRSFRRLPDAAEKGLSEAVRHLSRCPAGVFLSFFTDSPDIAIRVVLGGNEQMDHMPATGLSGAELYFRAGAAWHPVGVARPPLDKSAYERPLIEGATRAYRECRVYLPLYQRVDEVALGITPGARLAPAPASARPIFFYGTSITQGGCASTAGSDFVSTVGRLLDAEVVNFGFSGSGKGEPGMARLIRTAKVEMFVLDFLANAEVSTLEATLRRFLRLLREKQPRTPIALMSCPAFDKSLWHSETATSLEQKRDIAMRVALEARRRGDSRLHFIDGSGLLPAGLSGAYVDGVHPTSHGFAIMAERLAPQLQAIRLRHQV